MNLVRDSLTIGIPTYNRLSLLKNSLSSALQQNYSNIRIIVSDNNSNDGTVAYVESLVSCHPNLTLHRLHENVGAQLNFKKLLELCETEYFTWLQDDDLIHADLASRAINYLKQDDDYSIYFAYAQYKEETTLGSNMRFWGPSLNLNWIKNEALILSSNCLIPYSVFSTMGFSPVAIFRTKYLKKVVNIFKPDYWLFEERWIIIMASLNKKVIIDSYIGGLFRKNLGQASSSVTQYEYDHQLKLFLIQLNLYINKNLLLYENDFKNILIRIDNDILSNWYKSLFKFSELNEFVSFYFSLLKMELNNRNIFINVNTSVKTISFKRRLKKCIKNKLIYILKLND